MKAIVFGLFGLLSLGVFAQEDNEEFLPIEVEGKEAFMSTKTGEFTFREHAKTDPEQLRTTASGVVYTNITSHAIKKGETLFAVARKNGVTVDEIKKHNKVTSSNLKIGSKLKIVKKELVKSSSPVISYAGEERIIAKLRPGESPGQFAAPPSVADVESQVIETKKTEERPSAKVYKADTSVKNPIFGLDSSEETQEDASIENLDKAISEEVEVAKTEIESENVIVETAKTETKKETKQEKLARLKAEMKALEEEMDEEPVTEVVEDVKVQEPKEVLIVENVSKENDAETIERIKESNPEAKIEESENGKKVMVLESKPKTEETTAEKASRVIASVRKTELDVEVSKKEESLVEKDAEAKDSLEEEQEEAAYYTVEKGNSLWYIAKKHNMTVEALKELNNLKNNNLDIGQKLKVTLKK